MFDQNFRCVNPQKKTDEDDAEIPMALHFKKVRSARYDTLTSHSERWDPQAITLLPTQITYSYTQSFAYTRLV